MSTEKKELVKTNNKEKKFDKSKELINGKLEKFIYLEISGNLEKGIEKQENADC